MSPRTGRPRILNAKNHDIKVRIDDAMYLELAEYCNKTGRTKAEAIRDALSAFLKKRK